MENILKKIIIKKKENLIKKKKEFSETKVLNNIKSQKKFFSFIDNLKKKNNEKNIGIIAEIKQASPSAGLLFKNFDPINISKLYVDNGAACLSVLTEEDFFLGKLDYINEIKKSCRIPILSKDFFIDTYQVALAKSFGADCILIILSAVDDHLAKDLYQASNDLNISALIEVHSEREAEKALLFEKSIIGINNRNLKTLEVSIDTSVKIAKILTPHKNPIISESGFHSVEEINFVKKNSDIKNFLIGESLLTSEDIATKLKKFTQITL